MKPFKNQAMLRCLIDLVIVELEVDATADYDVNDAADDIVVQQHSLEDTFQFNLMFIMVYILLLVVLIDHFYCLCSSYFNRYYLCCYYLFHNNYILQLSYT